MQRYSYTVHPQPGRVGTDSDVIDALAETVRQWSPWRHDPADTTANANVVRSPINFGGDSDEIEFHGHRVTRRDSVEVHRAYVESCIRIYPRADLAWFHAHGFGDITDSDYLEACGRIKNVRFWAYVNGCAVRITLKPGQSIEHSEGGPCEEGYAYSGETWSYEDGIVTRQWGTDARDCDGRFTQSGEDYCRFDRLSDGNTPYIDDCDRLDAPHWEGVIWPDWKEERDTVCRDEFAEAAGY
jgi:hypothetical protein